MRARNFAKRGVEKRGEEKRPNGGDAENGVLPDLSGTLRILKSIKARGYRTLEFDRSWREQLQKFADILGGESEVEAEAQKLANWLEGRLESGKEKRDKAHNPRSRFLNSWLPRAVENRRTTSKSTLEQYDPKEGKYAGLEQTFD
jgi:hypothetical protein